MPAVPFPNPRALANATTPGFDCQQPKSTSSPPAHARSAAAQTKRHEHRRKGAPPLTNHEHLVFKQRRNLGKQCLEEGKGRLFGRVQGSRANDLAIAVAVSQDWGVHRREAGPDVARGVNLLCR